MDFFGLGQAMEMETPLGKLVGSATDPLLLGPDWAKNLEICDSITTMSDAAEVVKAIHHQLKSSDAKVVQLALTLIDTCIQNNWNYVPQAVNKSFMDEVVKISGGRKGVNNQDDALRLIQTWGRRFERKRSEVPLFFETYMMLRSQGVSFPPEDDAPIPQSSQSGAQNSTSHPKEVDEGVINPDAKITADLNVVLEKIRLCREMLPQSPGIASDDLLSEVVGFLEACQARLMELIEARLSGGENSQETELSEEVFEYCLRVNDALTRTLDAEKDGLVIDVDDEGTKPIIFGQKAASTTSGPTTSLLDEEIDEFSTLTMKTSNKKSSGGVKKIPTIKGPSTGGGKAKTSKGLLAPPPSSAASRPSQQVPIQQNKEPIQQNNIDLDFLSGASSVNSLPQPPSQTTVTAGSNNPFNTETPNVVPPPSQQPEKQRQSSSNNPILARTSTGEDLLDIFGTSNSSASQVNQAAPSSLGSAQMTDEEFESFLNK